MSGGNKEQIYVDGSTYEQAGDIARSLSITLQNRVYGRDLINLAWKGLYATGKAEEYLSRWLTPESQTPSQPQPLSKPTVRQSEAPQSASSSRKGQPVNSIETAKLSQEILSYAQFLTWTTDQPVTVEDVVQKLWENHLETDPMAIEWRRAKRAAKQVASN